MTDHTADIAYVEAEIAKLLTKLGKARDDGSRSYYRACIRGWQTTLEKVEGEGVTTGCPAGHAHRRLVLEDRPMKRNAMIVFRGGGFYMTQIDDESDTPRSIAQRMTLGGTIVCEETRWGEPRVLIVNLADVQSVALSEAIPIVN